MTNKQGETRKTESELPHRDEADTQQSVSSSKNVIQVAGNYLKSIQVNIFSVFKSSQEAQEESTIPPLEKPFVNLGTNPYSSSNGLEISRIIEGKSKDLSSRVFDITLSNTSNEQRILTDFEIGWKYLPGNTAMTVQGTVLVPVAEYIVHIPINVMDLSQKIRREVIAPEIIIPPGTLNNPSVTKFRLQVHYSLVGDVKYHPSVGWDFLFAIAVLTNKRDKLWIFAKNNFRVSRT